MATSMNRTSLYKHSDGSWKHIVRENNQLVVVADLLATRSHATDAPLNLKPTSRNCLELEASAPRDSLKNWSAKGLLTTCQPWATRSSSSSCPDHCSNTTKPQKCLLALVMKVKYHLLAAARLLEARACIAGCLPCPSQAPTWGASHRISWSGGPGATAPGTTLNWP